MEQVDLVMTEEQKKKMKDFLPFQIGSEFKYVPKAWKENLDKKLWPIFTLKSLNAIDLAELEDKSGYVAVNIKDPSKREFHGMSGGHRIETLKKGIVKWSNLRDGNGNLIEWKGWESIGTLPEKLQNELLDAITERLSINEEELQGLE